MKSGSADPDGDSTLDAFHRGAFWLHQPRGRGHRSGTDALMLAAAVPGGFAGRLADLGAGAGGAGMAVAARCAGARVTLVERDPVMADHARRTLSLPQNAAVAQRADLVVADVTLSGRARAEAGLGDTSFDFAIMNPPFNDGRDRASPDDLRRAAHVMEPDLLEAWIRTAAAIVTPQGGWAAILRPASLPVLLPLLAGRFGGAAIRPIHPHPDGDAIRVVIRAWRGSRAALALRPPLVLHDRGSNRFTDEADAIANGQAPLFAD